MLSLARSGSGTRFAREYLAHQEPAELGRSAYGMIESYNKGGEKMQDTWKLGGHESVWSSDV